MVLFDSFIFNSPAPSNSSLLHMMLVQNLDVALIYIIYAIGQLTAVKAIEVATEMPPKVEEVLKKTNMSSVKKLLNNTRRILGGSQANDNRPYMVYLKLPFNNQKFQEYKRWLCGGVIIHEEYILTSAACIEDVKHFYVVSGTNKHSDNFDRHNNPCIKNGARKAVWKCVPKNYVFDGRENDNIRWMNNDIAIVKIEEEFDFNRRVRGCDYIPRPVCYNNQSITFEDPGTDATVAGWGSIDKYNEWVNGRRQNDVTDLLEANVRLISKNMCKKRWGRRYQNIIENYMICSRDLESTPSEVCLEKYVECTDIVYDNSDEGGGSRRVINPESLVLHPSLQRINGTRKSTMDNAGGFCENDHGGPLIHGNGVNSMVIGIISACLVREKTNKCYGPFLYTSVYKNRQLINCAIYKDVGQDCSKLFRSSVTHNETIMSWEGHPDGPSKYDISLKTRRQKELNNTHDNSEAKNSEVDNTHVENVVIASTSTTVSNSKRDSTSSSTAAKKKTKIKHGTNEQKQFLDQEDQPSQHSGIIFRSYVGNSTNLRTGIEN